MSDDKAIVRFDPNAGFNFDTLDSMYRGAECYIQSGFAQRGMTPQQIVIIWAYGAEIGVRPLQALSGMTAINNRLGIMGDLALAKVRSTGLLVESPKKEYTGTGDDYTCTVTLHRKGDSEPREFSFSMREAKAARLLGNDNWTKYPQRMLYHRALGFGLTDLFTDVLKGLHTTEELQDYPILETEPTLKDDADKIQSNRQAESEAKARGIKFVKSSEAVRPTPEEAVEPGLKEDKERFESEDKTPQFTRTLKEDFVEQFHKEQSAEQPPDELDMSPPVEVEQEVITEPEPFWKHYKIQAIKTLMGKAVGDLDANIMARLETQWVPAMQAEIKRASPKNLEDLEAIRARIEHDKLASPW